MVALPGLIFRNKTKQKHTQTQKSRKCVRGKQLRKYEWFENMFPVKKFKILTR